MSSSGGRRDGRKRKGGKKATETSKDDDGADWKTMMTDVLKSLSERMSEQEARAREQEARQIEASKGLLDAIRNLNERSEHSSAQGASLQKRKRSDVNEEANASKKARVDSNEKIFGHLRCPISLQIFVDPVVAEDGQTYERSSFLQLAEGHRRFLSPITRAQISAGNYIPNLVVRKTVCEQIETFGRELPEEELEDYHRREAVRSVKARIDSVEEEKRCPIAVTVLKEAENAEVAAYALKSLVYFAKGTDRKGKVVELGGLKAAVEAMRKFDADAEVQRGGADVLAWMASTGTEMGQKIASEGGIEVFLKAVRGFPDNEKVLERNLCALGNVASNNPDNKVKIAEKGGIELAIEALKRHPGVAVVQENGCSMLGNLAANNPDNQVKIAEKGGIEVAIEALKRHPGNEAVQDRGCYVLYWMVDLKSAHPKIIKGKEQLEYAKSTYPNHAKIQQWSKIALKAL